MTHFICDPCYVIKDDQTWKELISEYARLSTNPMFDGHFTFKGESIFMHTTDVGDGVFVGSDGVSYSVDSGALAVIPFSLVKQDVIESTEENKVTMTQANLAKCRYDEGEFAFFTTEGRITIQTCFDEYTECEQCGVQIDSEELCWDCECNANHDNKQEA